MTIGELITPVTAARLNCEMIAARKARSISQNAKVIFHEIIDGRLYMPGGNTLLQWALAYARRGWPVFPCNPKTKRPLVKAEAAGEGGVKMATVDAAQIESLVDQVAESDDRPCDRRGAGVFVVDIDAGHDEITGEDFAAPDLLRTLETALGGALPPAWRVKTPRGGWHLYYRWPGETPVGNRGGLLGKNSESISAAKAVTSSCRHRSGRTAPPMRGLPSRPAPRR